MALNKYSLQFETQSIVCCQQQSTRTNLLECLNDCLCTYNQEISLQLSTLILIKSLTSFYTINCLLDYTHLFSICGTVLLWLQNFFLWPYTPNQGWMVFIRDCSPRTPPQWSRSRQWYWICNVLCL